MSKNDSPLREIGVSQRYAEERVELLETIQEIVAQEVDRRLKVRENGPQKNTPKQDVAD